MSERFAPGTRLRCVDETDGVRLHKHKKLTRGNEYVLRNDYRSSGDRFFRIDADDTGEPGGWLASRFKPVVRVKAPSRPMTIEELGAFVIERFNKLPASAKAEHWRQQRESWVRAELELSRLERGETRVQPATKACCGNDCPGCPNT